MFAIRKVNGVKGISEFIKVPYKIYNTDDKKVFSIKLLQKRTLSGKNNPLLSDNPHQFFIAYDDEGQAIGRILAGVNGKLNREKNLNDGFISLFECIDNKEVAFLLFDEAEKFLKEEGVDRIKGPVSPSNGDDDRGILIEGFEYAPTVMNVYNPPYYADFFNEYGFQKDMDLYAFLLTVKDLDIERFQRVVTYAMKKFKYRVDQFDKGQLRREIRDIHEILVKAMPSSWMHLAVPDEREIYAEVKTLMPFVDESLVYIARFGEQPIGFVAAIPDYNQVLAKMKGKLFPFGIYRFYKYRKTIDGARIFIQFVVPGFQSKGVNGAIFYRLMLEAGKKGYRWGEGSTVAEMNKEAIRSIQGAGGKLYKIYRMYKKDMK